MQGNLVLIINSFWVPSCRTLQFNIHIGIGTGAVKITPVHNPNNNECNKRHNLEFITILTENGAISHNDGGFQGLMTHKHL
jgi:valyl-tRNA synthetase